MSELEILAWTIAVTVALVAAYFFLSSMGWTKNFSAQLTMLVVTIIGLLSLVALAAVGFDRLTQSQKGTEFLPVVLAAVIGLASTTILGNALAGIQMRLVNAFDKSDFLRIDGHFGKVLRRGLFHTEIMTEDGDRMSLPNLYIANQPVKRVLKSGTIISATVSIGYDTKSSDVDAQLREAARRTLLTVKLDSAKEEPDSGPRELTSEESERVEKSIFVQIVELGDYAVTYRVGGRLLNTEVILTRRSLLREEMMECLHAKGIEIMSPMIMATRPLPLNDPVIPQLGPTAGSEPKDPEEPEEPALEQAFKDDREEPEEEDGG